jgi:hypothetical protein
MVWCRVPRGVRDGGRAVDESPGVIDSQAPLAALRSPRSLYAGHADGVVLSELPAWGTGLEALDDLLHVSLCQTILEAVCSSDPSPRLHALFGSLSELAQCLLKVNREFDLKLATPEPTNGRRYCSPAAGEHPLATNLISTLAYHTSNTTNQPAGRRIASTDHWLRRLAVGVS